MSTARSALVVFTTSLLISCGHPSKSHRPLGGAEFLPASPVKTASNPPAVLVQSPSLLTSPLPDDPMAATIHRLSNGLTVYISTDRSVPSISAWIAVSSGSRHDPANSTGLAHYLEHMLFKGSSKLGSLDFSLEKPHLDKIAKLYDQLRASANVEARNKVLASIDAETLASSKYSIPNEFDNLYASLGIDGVNAFTSEEQTVYIADVPSNRFEAWAKVEGDRFSDPQFRLFYPELESVYEEKNRSLDSPQSRISEAIAKNLFPHHPYGTQPTIGLAEHLKSPAYADMVQYFKDWYRPNNMAIVLAGDIDAATALPILEKRFGKMQARELPELPASDLRPPSTRKEVVIAAPGEQSLFLAWPTVRAGDADEMALVAMDLVIDNASTGLLNIDLLLSQELPSAGSFVQVMHEAGMWILTGTAREGQSLDEVEAKLMGVVSKLKGGRFTQEDLSAIVLNSEISQKKGLESNGSRVSAMVNAFIQERPWTDVVAQPAALQAVTREDVIRVANKYLTQAPVVVKRVRGEFQSQKVTKPTISTIKIDSSKHSDFAKAVKALKSDPIKPQWLVEGEHYRRGKTLEGGLVSVRNERNDLFSIEYAYKFGEEQEPLICLALHLLERSGAGKRTAIQLHRDLYALGSTIDFYCGSTGFSIQISGIDRAMEDSLAMLREWLLDPVVKRDSLRKLVDNTVSERKDAMRSPSVISMALSEFSLRGRESRFLKLPSNKTLRRTKTKPLLALLKKLPRTRHQTTYFGPRESENLGEVLSLASLPMKPKTGQKSNTARRLAPLRVVRAAKPNLYRHPKKATLYFVDQKVAQAQIQVSYAAEPLAKEDILKSKIFNQYVGGGMGGLIFQEIREARGLAYSAWASYAVGSRPKDESVVVAGLGTQADKSIDALGTLLSLIAPLKVQESRFRVAKVSLQEALRTERISPRNRASRVYQWSELGYSSDPRKARYAALAQSTAQQLQDFANERTKVSASFAISGDNTRIDLKKLAEIAHILKVKIVKPAALFGY